MTHRKAITAAKTAIAAWLGAASCGSPTSPQAPEPWGAPMHIADVTDRSGPSSRFGYSPLSCLAGAADGRTLFVWVRRETEADEIWARALSPGGEPGPAGRLQGASPLPRIDGHRCALDDAGEGFVSWVEYSAEQSRLLARRITAHGWEDPVLLDRRDHASAYVSERIRHDLAVDPGGRALIAWLSPEAIRSAIAINGTWNDAGVLAEGPVRGERPDVKVELRGAFGIATYVRDGLRAGGNAVGDEAHVRLLDASGRWSPAVSLGWERAIAVLNPAIDERGHAIVATLRTTAPTFLYLNRWQGSAWSDLERLPDSSIYTTAAFAGAPDGEAIALIPDSNLGTVEAARWRPDQTVPLRETVARSVPLALNPFVAFSPSDGSVHAIWLSERRPWLARSPRPGEWEVEPVKGARIAPSPCPTDREAAGASEPNLRPDARGGVLVTWIDNQCGPATLWAQRVRDDR